MKMTENSAKGQKALWEKEKLLITSNVSFSLSVFKRLALQTHKKQGLFWKGLTLRPVSSDRTLANTGTTITLGL